MPFFCFFADTESTYDLLLSPSLGRGADAKGLTEDHLREGTGVPRREHANVMRVCTATCTTQLWRRILDGDGSDFLLPRRVRARPVLVVDVE